MTNDQPTSGNPPPIVPERQRRRRDWPPVLGAVLCVLGLLPLLTMALSWVSATAGNRSYTASGYTVLREGGDGGGLYLPALFVLMLSLALVGVGAALVVLKRSNTRLMLSLAAALLGLGVLSGAATTRGELPDGVNAGAGLLSTLLLAVAMMAVGITAAFKSKPVEPGGGDDYPYLGRSAIAAGAQTAA